MLAGQLGHAVDVHRPGRVQLVDRRPQRPPVDLSRAVCTTRTVGLTSTEDLQERAWVTVLTCRSRSGSRIDADVADLTGEVEDDVGTGRHDRRSTVADLAPRPRRRGLRRCGGRRRGRTRASTIRTRAPRANQSWTTFEPMNPSPPVTTHVRSADASADGGPGGGTAGDRRRGGGLTGAQPVTKPVSGPSSASAAPPPDRPATGAWGIGRPAPCGPRPTSPPRTQAGRW